MKLATAEVVYVCTDYKRHEPKPGKAAKPDEGAAPLSQVGTPAGRTLVGVVKVSRYGAMR